MSSTPATTVHVRDLIDLGVEGFLAKYATPVMRPLSASVPASGNAWSASTIAALQAEQKKAYQNYLRAGDVLAANPDEFIFITDLANRADVPVGNLVAAFQQLGGFVKKNGLRGVPHVKRWDLGPRNTRENQYMFTSMQAEIWKHARA